MISHELHFAGRVYMPDLVGGMIQVSVIHIWVISVFLVALIGLIIYIFVQSIKKYAMHYYKSASSTIRLQECKYQAVFNYLPEGVFIIESASGRILEANKTACMIYDMKPEDLIGSTVGQLCNRDRPSLEEVAPGVFLAVHKDSKGNKIPVEVAMKVIKTLNDGMVTMCIIKKFSSKEEIDVYARGLSTLFKEKESGLKL